jgi:hypothetical protein
MWDGDGGDVAGVWKWKYFCTQGWTGQISLIRLRNFGSARSALGGTLPNGNA